MSLFYFTNSSLSSSLQELGKDCWASFTEYRNCDSGRKEQFTQSIQQCNTGTRIPESWLWGLLSAEWIRPFAPNITLQTEAGAGVRESESTKSQRRKRHLNYPQDSNPSPMCEVTLGSCLFSLGNLCSSLKWKPIQRIQTVLGGASGCPTSYWLLKSKPREHVCLGVLIASQGWCKCGRN